MGNALEYQGRGAERGATGVFRRVAFWGNLGPLVSGVGGFLGWWWGGVESATLVCSLALLWSVVSVPMGVVLMGMHLLFRCPEADGRHRWRRAVLAGVVVLAVWPAAYVCEGLYSRMTLFPVLEIVNTSGAATDFSLDGVKVARLEAGGSKVVDASRFRSDGLPVVEALVPGRPVVVVKQVGHGLRHPFRGYRVEWDGVGWRQVR